jgi:hypothetical protein
MSAHPETQATPSAAVEVSPAAKAVEVEVVHDPALSGEAPGARLLGLSTRRLAVAFAIAAVADTLSIMLTVAPPLEWGLDFATAAALFLVLGRRWLLLPALVMEAIPGLWVFPFWVLVVGAIALTGQVKPKVN